jgi:hypothetical protein
MCLNCGKAQPDKAVVYNESEVAEKLRNEFEVSSATKSFGISCLILIAIPVALLLIVALYASFHPGWKPFI